MSEFSKNFMKWCAGKSDLFLETGTFKGVTTKLAAGYFKSVISIEIDQQNHKNSKAYLKDLPNVKLILGDTSEVFPVVLEENQSVKMTMWLDAHPMDPEKDAACPILEELDAIAEKSGRNDHIIIIDDLQRCLKGDGDYPSVADMTEKLKKINANYHIYQLPFRSWGTPAGEPSVLCASTEKIEFPDKFYLNKFNGLKKYLRALKISR